MAGREGHEKLACCIDTDNVLCGKAYVLCVEMCFAGSRLLLSCHFQVIGPD